ncbi:MAG TPA: endolytic transglycosylase MltG [Acidobacteriaceae bacterium]|nr:endolytic transglycosylase MltG [Acidobacteriaceae bacterium]
MKFFGFLLLLAFLAAGLAAWLIYTPFGPAANSNPIYVDIAPGMGSQSIATQLQKAGAIRSRYAFLILRALKGRNLLAGEYRFDRPAPAIDVYSRIARGDVYTVALTIPEGSNIFDIADAVDKAGLVPHDKFLAAERADTSLINDLSPNAASLEGYLFPDTYRFPHHITAEKILSTMVARFRKVAAQWNIPQLNSRVGWPGAPEWGDPPVVGSDGKIHEKPHSSRDVNKPLDLTQIVSLASLVEKEVSQDSERPMVAGVFLNRLAQKMPLATDPTIIYAALLNDRWRGTIYASDLKYDSPYNTYIHAGLPPGPICNPGLAALKAALHPAPTQNLYFVADGQGHSVFSATLQQHNQQVAAWRRATHH